MAYLLVAKKINLQRRRCLSSYCKAYFKKDSLECLGCGLTVLGKYTLIITEKPDAANRIATALDIEGKAKKIVDSGVPYYQAYRNGDLVVVPALGHLYTVASKEKAKRDYPVFDYHWVPRYLAERGASKIRVWLKVIAKLGGER